MTSAVNINEVLDGRVSLEIDCVDRLLLNAYVPNLQVGGQVDKITEWIERSGGKVRADVVHDKLRAMGYTGSERTTRRVVAALKKSYRRQRPHRVYKPWITERRIMAPVRLRGRPGRPRREGGALLRMAGLEPLPGHPSLGGPQHAVGDHGARPHLPADRGRQHLCAH
jgi:hypothetical protein